MFSKSSAIWRLAQVHCSPYGAWLSVDLDKKAPKENSPSGSALKNDRNDPSKGCLWCAAFSHPDFNCRLWIYTRSTIGSNGSRAIPPVRNLTCPRRMI